MSNETRFRKILAKESPKSGWYDTELGKLYYDGIMWKKDSNKMVSENPKYYFLEELPSPAQVKLTKQEEIYLEEYINKNSPNERIILSSAQEISDDEIKSEIVDIIREYEEEGGQEFEDDVEYMMLDIGKSIRDKMSSLLQEKNEQYELLYDKYEGLTDGFENTKLKLGLAMENLNNCKNYIIDIRDQKQISATTLNIFLMDLNKFISQKMFLHNKPSLQSSQESIELLDWTLKNNWKKYSEEKWQHDNWSNITGTNKGVICKTSKEVSELFQAEKLKQTLE